MRARVTKDCYCYTCDREFNYLGIARHRAAHRDRHEDCTIRFTYGNIRVWKYSELERNEG
nr:MAG TPA: hypothetical protein [Caudoviricetes sp.]